MEALVWTLKAGGALFVMGLFLSGLYILVGSMADPPKERRLCWLIAFALMAPALVMSVLHHLSV